MSRFMMESIQQRLSTFAPCFWFFDGKRFKCDRQMQSLFQLDSTEIGLEVFLRDVDEHGADFLRRFFSSGYEDSLTLKFFSTKGGDTTILLQGRILDRDAEGRVTCGAGYCIELGNRLTVPSVFYFNEVGKWEWNGVTDECQFCEAYRKMLGYQPGDAFPQTFKEWILLVHPDDLDAVEFQKKLAVYPELGNSFECSIRLRHKGGYYIWTLGKGFVARRNQLGHALSIRGTIQNIEPVRKKYEKFLQEVTRDSLTNCYSRDFFKSKWSELLERDVYPISFIYVDICGLKMINDLLGHDLGDKVIVATVEIIEQVVRMPKFVIRMGGDEFLVILPNCTPNQAAECVMSLKRAASLRRDAEMPVVFAVGQSSMIIKSSLVDSLQCAERDMQRNKETTREQDLDMLTAYIENTRGEKIDYTDTRLKGLRPKPDDGDA